MRERITRKFQIKLLERIIKERAKALSIDVSKTNQRKALYGDIAIKLNEIMESMNNEEAYMSWIYLYPDGETYEEAIEDFGTKRSLFDLWFHFIDIYLWYHEDGLFRANREVLVNCYKLDNELRLKGIENYGN